MKKICSRCKIWKTRDLKNFINRPKNSDKLSGQCRDCINDIKRESYKKDSSKVLAQCKRYRENNKEKVSQAYKIYTEKNQDRIKKNKAIWWDKVKDKKNQEKREKYEHIVTYTVSVPPNFYEKKYAKDNKEKLALYNKEYRAKNAQTIAEIRREYVKTDAYKVAKANSRHKRRVVEKQGNLPANAYPMSVELFDLLKFQNNKCNECGCLISHSIGNIHLDHIIPLSKGGTHTIDNVQWLCASCNLSKGAKVA